MQLNVNTDATVVLTNKLEKLSRSAFPVAVRNTLNSAAFDMKKDTILKSAEDNFVQRKPTFFKANTKVETAKGFSISRMAASVGFTGKSQAVDDMEQQEKGGKIDGRSFVPLDSARTGNSNSKNIRPNARLKNIKKIIDTKNAKGANDKEKFVKSVNFAGVGGFVLADYKNEKILWRINSIKKTDDEKFKLTALYTFKKGRDVNIEPTHFMKEATDVTSKKVDDFYFIQANKQFEKALR